MNFAPVLALASIFCVAYAVGFVVGRIVRSFESENTRRIRRLRREKKLDFAKRSPRDAANDNRP